MSIAAVAQSTTAGAPAASDPGTVLIGLLEQLRDVITLLPHAIYVARPAARVSGSVGEHVRHCLDHMSALALAMAGDDLDYDRRARGTMVEVDPATAVNEIERLFVRFDRMTDRVFDRTLTLPIAIDPSSARLMTRSSITRETAYVIHHTIHHFAVIAVLLDWQGWRVPQNFGTAPSTLMARAAV